MKFQVSIEEFNGPLDLMLYLIKDQKLDLFDLNIVELADQYIAFINQAQDQKFEVATEYLSELAGLIEYKSKKLLPRDKSEFDANEVEDEQDLVQRLIEYQRYKEVSIDLAHRFEERMQSFSKPIETSLFKEIQSDLKQHVVFEHNPYDLMKAMDKVLNRYRLANPQDVSFEKVELSVDDIIDDLRIRFTPDYTVSLDNLLLDSRSLHHLIITFLAILDLLRMNEIAMSVQGEIVYLKGVF
ncbi:ScpA family protein [Erysipelothrix urinaevulpis]|uniref:segregation and condensation protein A n=1 Tax=Erysipelothrix urinaevulpis TaxID=2683717 RepID=UPI0013571F01|nr:segregation/condensation protein A [Erysipelothrix urinaevulpis]